MSLDVRFTKFKSDKQPTWCPGRGDFGTMNGMMKALANTGNDPDSTFVVAGIGCSGKIGTYMYSYALHGVAAILNRVDDDTLRSGIGCPSYR